MTWPPADLRVGPNIMSVIQSWLARAHSKALVGPLGGGGRVGFEGTGVQVVGRHYPVNRGQAEGARLERALLQELAHHRLDGQLRMLLAPLYQRLAGLRAELHGPHHAAD